MNPTHLTPDQLERFNERAAIREFEANLPRDVAEQLALMDVEGHPLAGKAREAVEGIEQ